MVTVWRKTFLVSICALVATATLLYRAWSFAPLEVTSQSFIPGILRVNTSVTTHEGDITTSLTSPLLTSPSAHQYLPVLLLTYYRGGSSFLGELFNQNMDCFYWFEPLHILPYLVKDMKAAGRTIDSLYTVTGQDTLRPLTSPFVNVSRDTLLKTLTCDVTHMYKAVVLNDSFVRKAQHTHGPHAFNKCMKSPEASGDKCLPVLTDTCLKAKIHAVKTIRASMYMAPFLLDRLPNLKVIYYTRDPRGVMDSRRMLHTFDLSTFRDNARNLCLREMYDFDAFARIEKRYRGRLMHLRYEDLAREPATGAETIYKFLGSSGVPPEVARWINSHTKSAPSNARPYTTRRDSDVTARRWMTSLPRPLIRVVEAECKDVIQKLNYTL